MNAHSAAPVRYVPSASKALEVILWLADSAPGIDLYHAVQAVFLADKAHLSAHGRPILGDEYRAAPFGPLPQLVYGLLARQPIEMLALGLNGPLPFRVDEAHRLHAERGPNLRKLSQSDVAALRFGLNEVEGKSFADLSDLARDDPAWRNAAAGVMDYRDFLPEAEPDRDRKIEDIEETAPLAVF